MPEYLLGHAASELSRLATQARLIDPITRRCLMAAGLSPGMRVLDVGSGAGDVAILLADLVGPSGLVVGTDLSAAAIATAQRRMDDAALAHVTLRQGDPATMLFDAPFDAVVGRYVLQFIADPAAALAKLAGLLRPAGIMFFHELDWDGARSAPAVPTYDLVCGWIRSTIEASGASARLGPRLPSLFARAALAQPTLRLEAVIGSGDAALDAVHLVTDLVATLLPEMERRGVATAPQVDVATLASRIMAEIGPGGTVIGRSEIAAWTTT